MKFLIFTTDLIPLPGKPTSGTALRTWSLGQGLAEGGHQVIYSVPQSVIGKLPADSELPAEYKKLRANSFSARNQDKLIRQLNPDVVIFGHWPAFQLNEKPEQVCILDLAGPHLLERHYQGSDGQEAAVAGKCAALANIDGVIVSGKRQAAYFSAFFSQAGRPDLSSKSIEIPIALSPESKAAEKVTNFKKTPSSFPRFLFGGVFLPWQDPSWALSTLVDFIEQKATGSLRLIGGKHPNYSVDSGVYKKLFSSLEKSSRVTVSPLLPMEKFVAELSGADVAIDLMERNLERELALTIRSTTYLWAGLPVIYNDFSDLSDLIKQYDAGWLANKSNLESILREILSSPELVSKKSKNALRLSKEHFHWNIGAEKILSLVKGLNKRTAYDFSVNQPDSIVRSDAESGTMNISQEFVVRRPRISSIGICFNSETLSSDSSVELKLLGGEHELFRKVVSIPGQYRQRWYEFELPDLKVEAGETLRLEIESPKGLQPWLAHYSKWPSAALKVNEEIQSQASLCMRLGVEL